LRLAQRPAASARSLGRAHGNRPRQGQHLPVPSLVDWPTIAALTGLLVLTKGLEASGSLNRLGVWLIGFMATERTAALCLVLAAALLSTVLTNDVALFVVVPLTRVLCSLTGMPATKLIIFEALAVNAGSALTPVGNPQNLFLWQLSGVSFGEFNLHMLPLVTLLMVLLLTLTACVFRGHSVSARRAMHAMPLDRRLLGVSLALYLPFLVATDWHHAGWAVAAVLVIFVCCPPGADATRLGPAAGVWRQRGGAASWWVHWPT
jgi:di/tricarboxylate transporter